jgi:hypothetical protein
MNHGRALTRLRVVAALAALAGAQAARAEGAREQLIEAHFGFGFLWLETTSGGAPEARNTGGLGLVEVGVTLRPSRQVQITPFVRAGLIYTGGGLEVAAMPWADWSQSGVVLSVAPTVTSDFFTCVGTKAGTTALVCDSAYYFVVEAGLAYRWILNPAKGLALSLGLVLNAGQQRLNPQNQRGFAVGVLGPKVVIDVPFL